MRMVIKSVQNIHNISISIITIGNKMSTLTLMYCTLTLLKINLKQNSKNEKGEYQSQKKCCIL